MSQLANQGESAATLPPAAGCMGRQSQTYWALVPQSSETSERPILVQRGWPVVPNTLYGWYIIVPYNYLYVVRRRASLMNLFEHLVMLWNSVDTQNVSSDRKISGWKSRCCSPSSAQAHPATISSGDELQRPGYDRCRLG